MITKNQIIESECQSNEERKNKMERLKELIGVDYER